MNLGLMYHPGIETSSSILQCKFPPFSAKLVHPSVNLPPKPNKKGDLHLPAVSLQVFATEPCCLLACPGPPRAVSIVPHPVRPGTAERQPQEKRTWTGRSDVTHPKPDRPTARAS